MLLRGFGGMIASVALIDVGQFDRTAGHLPDLFDHRRKLLAVAVWSRCDLQRIKCPSVATAIYLRSLAPLGAIVTCTTAALRRGLPRGCRRIPPSAGPCTLRRAAATLAPGPPGSRNASLDPATHPGVHRWQIVRQVMQLVNRPHNTTNAVNSSRRLCFRLRPFSRLNSLPGYMVDALGGSFKRLIGITRWRTSGCSSAGSASSRGSSFEVHFCR